MEESETLSQKTIRLAQAPKSLRQMMYTAQSDSDEGRTSAAIEIQRIARGYIVRKLGLEVYTSWRANSMPHRSLATSYASGLNIETRHNVSHQSERYPETPCIPEPLNDEKRQNLRTNHLTKHQAAVRIQRFWRRHIDVQVYKYYRDLINFKNQGDPATMLKCVNPKEAGLLDAACGIHVKFRLAGEKFPPNIYYKIFTHRPIQDLCANAPRDYTKSKKGKDMKCTHNKNFTVPDDDKENWYKRIENNGWRLVSDRLITHMLNDPVTWSTHSKQINFHHEKLIRKQDQERKKKKRKIDWMKKMYQEGLLHAKTSDPETRALVEGATAGMVSTIEIEGEEAVEEWEVDELLDWTTSLNFEDYVGDWKQIGTSTLSEVPVEKRLVLTAGGADLGSTSPSQLTSHH